jgi:hypothetical protein
LAVNKDRRAKGAVRHRVPEGLFASYRKPYVLLSLSESVSLLTSLGARLLQLRWVLGIIAGANLILYFQEQPIFNIDPPFLVFGNR